MLENWINVSLSIVFKQTSRYVQQNKQLETLEWNQITEPINIYVPDFKNINEIFAINKDGYNWHMASAKEKPFCDALYY